jgi:1-acyl-sn-glycerol-3-phosphate acyltransferase
MRGDINWFVGLVSTIVRILTGIFERVTVVGAIDRIPRSGPVVVASNHASNIDPLVIGGWILPAMGRRLHWLSKKEVTDAPILGPLARAGSVHGIDRGAADVDAFRTALAILEAGHALLIFPEGTRSKDGALQRAHDGAATLALRAGATIVPVGLIGTAEAWPRGSTLPRFRRRIVARVGEPFALADVLEEGLDRRRAKEAATEEIMCRIGELLPPGQQGAYREAIARRAEGGPAEGRDGASGVPGPQAAG